MNDTFLAINGRIFRVNHEHRTINGCVLPQAGSGLYKERSADDYHKVGFDQFSERVLEFRDGFSEEDDMRPVLNTTLIHISGPIFDSS